MCREAVPHNSDEMRIEIDRVTNQGSADVTTSNSSEGSLTGSRSHPSHSRTPASGSRYQEARVIRRPGPLTPGLKPRACGSRLVIAPKMNST